MKEILSVLIEKSLQQALLIASLSDHVAALESVANEWRSQEADAFQEALKATQQASVQQKQEVYQNYEDMRALLASILD